jgi:competence protein ComEC
LGAAAFYLALSGAEVATQRAFIMIAIVLIGVMVDRPTLTFRTLTVAAFGVLLLAPEAIIHPSFQMSFAATLALVAGYQQGLPWMSQGGDTPLATKIALWGGREIVGLLIVSLLAGTATIPYIAYHFHRVSPYGVVANLIAMPIVSAWIMPIGILGLISMPFGLDGLCWRLMGEGVGWMTSIAVWVTSFPGALGRVAAFGAAPLLLCTGGLVVLCLFKTPLRLIGAALIGGAILLMLRAPKPDVLIAAGGSAVALRGENGRLSMVKSGSDVFAFREWLAADADARAPTDSTLGEGVRCDAAGCIGKLRDGSLVAIAKTLEAFEEDCRRAVLVVSARDAPPGCTALVIDRDVWRRSGAMALRRRGEQFEITATRPPGYDRPWARAAVPTAETRLSRAARRRRSRAMPRRAETIWRRAIDRPRFVSKAGTRDQYRRNKPTSLPWMRTRFGGRILTS